MMWIHIHHKGRHMAVWVDDMRIAKHGKLWCHLVADSWEEMHDFALHTLKLEARRFHGKAKLPHYDVTIWERELALQLGAVTVHHRQIVVCARKLLAAQ